MTRATLEELDRRMRELAAGRSREEVRAELRAEGIEPDGLAASILAEVQRRSWRELASQRQAASAVGPEAT